MSGQSDVANWISAISSLTAAIIAIVTLLTVYIGAIQLLSQNRMYRLGLSWRSLGPWQPTVAKWALFGLQRRICPPTVSLKFLTESLWKPNITFPAGFTKNKNDCIEKAELLVQANASWVNFMQALGLSPDDKHLYEIRDASELVNGIVPMHWTGKDLVGMCSMLGFQAYEDSPSFKSPMPLPMQWSGPLGWMQFRSSTNGCVAEFRLRMPLYDQIKGSLHHHYKVQSLDLPPETYLRSRLWNSINGLALDGNRALYLGGADGDPRPQEAEEEPGITQDALFEDLMSNDYSDEEIKRMLLGRRERQPKVPRRDAERKGLAKNQRAASGRDGEIPDFLNAMLRDKMHSCQLKQVLRPSPGLLSVAVEGELAYSRGLIVTDCQEYDRKYTKAEDIDDVKYPHNLGDLYMGRGLLCLMKEALMLFQPDGFYFSPTYHLCRDLHEIYHDIEDQSNFLKHIFPNQFIQDQNEQAKPANAVAATISASQHRSRECLRFAMELCNDLQDTRKTARACFSVDDMRLLAKAASALREVVLAPKSGTEMQKPQDLLWAMLYCGELSRDVLQALETAKATDFLAARVTCENEMLDCEALGRAAAPQGEKIERETWRYYVPLVANGEFTGEHVVAAVAATFITYYWIDKAWITNVAVYDNTMPQNVLMC